MHGQRGSRVHLWALHVWRYGHHSWFHCVFIAPLYYKRASIYSNYALDKISHGVTLQYVSWHYNQSLIVLRESVNQPINQSFNQPINQSINQSTNQPISMFTARILVKLSGIYVTLFACLPLPSLFVRYAHLTVMISLSRERGLLYGSDTSLCNYWPFALEPTPSYRLPPTRSTLLTGEQSAFFVLSRLLSSLWVSRTGSASDWRALQEALYKCIDTIQYNVLLMKKDSSLRNRN